MKIAVIILTMMRAWRTEMLEALATGTKVPDRVIIVNNSDQWLSDAYRSWPFDVDVLSTGKNIWIGPAQNWAISNLRDEEAVCFLSDDVWFRPNFLERVCYGLSRIADAGCICPATVSSRGQYRAYPLRDYYQNMRRREGWAFTFKRSVLDRIPPVPSELRLFYSDNWFFYHTKRLRYRWYRDLGTVVLHICGASINTFYSESKVMMREEMMHYKRYKREWAALCD
jgi:GT2 family glycosyltransferase